MDKCREAFEKLPVIEEIMGDDYVMFDEQFKEYLCGVGANEEYLNGAWMVWQSRQSEFDSMTEALLNQTQLLAKQKVEIDFLSAQLGLKRDQIKGFESEIKKTWQALEEKDKRIESLIAQIEMSDFKDSLGHELKSNLAYLDLKALRGEHE